MKYILGFFFLSFLGVIIAFFYVYSLVRFDAYSIIDYNPKLTTQIYDKNYELIANIFDDEHRLYVLYDDIPPRIIEALVAVEDTTFFEHSGVNPEAIFRAIIKDIKAMKLAEGASTITQQLIKNIALTREKSFIRKIKEAVLAVKIESTLSKEEIMERYFNHVYFGHGYYGVKTASKGYFRKELNELTLKEISILVGLPKAPSAYDPTKNYKLSISRANKVLLRLNMLGWISESEYKESLLEEPIVYDDTLTLNKSPYVVDEVIKQASKYFPDVKSGGYIIELGIDIKVQNIANKALKFGYEKIIERNKDLNMSSLNGSMIVLENNTGNILALVGGIDYEKSNFNRVTQSNRQPGSSFKPFVYQVALDVGFSPMSKIPDISRVYKNENEDWKPKNYGSLFEGLVTLKDALKNSRNLATINLLNTLGLESVHSRLDDQGFKNIPKDLSIALGTFGISSYDFAKFYSIFANSGEMIEPRLIVKITNRFKNSINYETNKRKIVEPNQNYLMVDMLKTAVSQGTGRLANVEGIEIAGKTGTTNNNIDVWFCGFTPDIEILIWYGNDDNSPMSKFETGSRTAAPVFKNFIEEYVDAYPHYSKKFQIPKGVNKAVYEGKTVYFTNKSPLPKQSKTMMEEDSTLLF